MTRSNFSRGEQLRHARAVGEIELDEAEARRGFSSDREPRLLEPDVVVVVEVVEADHLVAALEQDLRRVVADEAGGAGDEDFHVRAARPLRPPEHVLDVVEHVLLLAERADLRDAHVAELLVAPRP